MFGDLRGTLEGLTNMSFSDADVKSRLAEWENQVNEAISKMGLKDVPSVKFRGTQPMSLLPIETQTELMSEFRRITGIGALLDSMGMDPNGGAIPALMNQVENIWSSPSFMQVRDITSPNPYGRISTSGDNLIDILYRSLTFQRYDEEMDGARHIKYRPTKSGVHYNSPITSGGHAYGVGSVPTVDSLDQKLASRSYDLRGKTGIVFDIETAGFGPGMTRDLSYERVSWNAAGSSTVVPEPAIVFDTHQFGRGTSFDPDIGRSVTLSDFAATKYGIGSPGPMGAPSGGAYIDKVMPFLREAAQQDYIVGHNISNFDIPKLFQDLAGTSRYASDQAFRSEVDSLYSTIRPKIVDSLEVARSMPALSGLGIYSGAGDRVTAYSIENILMNTNLIDLMGEDTFKGLLGWDGSGFDKTLHQGAVDSAISRGIIEHADNLVVRTTSGGAPSAFRGSLERLISQSAAITPFTDILDDANIAPSVRALLSPGERINPIEHSILETRRLGGASTLDSISRAASGIDPEEFVDVHGQFRRLLKMGDAPIEDVYNSIATPSPEAYSDFQKFLADKNMPFAGLSYEERLFATGLGDITRTSALSSRYGLSELGISAFDPFKLDSIDLISGSRKASLPIELLEELGVLDGPNRALYSLSVVRPTEGFPSGAVNLVFRPDQAQIDSLTSTLKTIATDSAEASRILGVDGSSLSGFMSKVQGALDDGLEEVLSAAGRDGINVAQLADDSEGIVSRTIRFLAGASGVSVEDIRDDRLPAMVLPSMGRDELSGQILTGPSVLNKGLNRAATEEEIRLAQHITNDKGRGFNLPGTIKDAKMSARIKMVTRAKTTDAVEKVKTLSQRYSNISSKVPNATLGAAVAAAGLYYLFSRGNKDKYNEPMEYVGPEDGQVRYQLQEHIRHRQETGMGSYARKMDPLATASLTSNLNANRTNHHAMGYDRNNMLYGGRL